jgi:hypothetical protein
VHAMAMTASEKTTSRSSPRCVGTPAVSLLVWTWLACGGPCRHLCRSSEDDASARGAESSGQMSPASWTHRDLHAVLDPKLGEQPRHAAPVAAGRQRSRRSASPCPSQHLSMRAVRPRPGRSCERCPLRRMGGRWRPAKWGRGERVVRDSACGMELPATECRWSPRGPRRRPGWAGPAW